MVVIEGRHRVQADQGVTDITQRLVYLLDQSLEIRTGGKQGRQLKPEEGDGLARGAQQQPAKQRGEN